MKSPVYFANIWAFFDQAGFSGIITPHDKMQLNFIFGERGNDKNISPVYVRQVVEKVRERGGVPILTKTNLYLENRSNAVDHIITAVLHGFDFRVIRAPKLLLTDFPEMTGLK